MLVQILSHLFCNWLLFASFREKLDMAVRLFDALKMEAQFLRLVIQDATNALALAYKVNHFISTAFVNLHFHFHFHGLLPCVRMHHQMC